MGTKLEQVQLARSTAEADLAIEKQWRATLQVSKGEGLGCSRGPLCRLARGSGLGVVEGHCRFARGSGLGLQVSKGV